MKISTVAVSPEEDLKLRTQNRERDATQVELDGIVGGVAATWREMAKDPATVPELQRPRGRIAVSPDDKVEAKSRLRRAGTLHKVAVVFFEDAKDGKGNAVVTFTVGPPKPQSHGN